MVYSPINLDYFLNMEIANGGISKQVVTLNGKLKTIRDLDLRKKTGCNIIGLSLIHI